MKNLGLQYGGTCELEFEGYSDSDFAADQDKRRSTGGFVFTFAGGVIDWSSKFLPTVATSTMCCNPESASSQAKLDRMCVHAGDGQTYLVKVDSMS